jgi:hypothetical protein
MSVGDQRCETRMADQASRLLKRRGLWTIGAGATKRPYQLSGRAYVVWYEHGGLMTANCLWRTGESRAMSCVSCAPLPHQARQRLQLQRRTHGLTGRDGALVDDEGCYRPR